MKIQPLLERIASTIKVYVDRQDGELGEQVKALAVQQKSFHIQSTEQMVEALLPKLPAPIKGDPGHTPTPEELQAFIQPFIPAPLVGEKGTDGKDGIDGKDGQDGRTPSPEEIKSLIEPLIPVAEKGLDGRNGRDGIDGKDGRPGRDAAQIEVMAIIDETRSYPRGAYATHKGGFWRAHETTNGMRGWECITEGIAEETESLGDDGRTITRKTMYSSGRVFERSFAQHVLLDKGVFKPELKYAVGDVVTFGGSLWIAQKHEAEYGKPGEIGSGWRLSVRAGRDYRDPKR